MISFKLHLDEISIQVHISLIILIVICYLTGLITGASLKINSSEGCMILTGRAKGRKKTISTIEGPG